MSTGKGAVHARPSHLDSACAGQPVNENTSDTEACCELHALAVVEPMLDTE